MAQNDDDSTRARVLDLIAEKGPVSAAQLAKVLSLTPAAVRRHITALEEAEQIEVHSPALSGKRGRGRPARHYVLTPKARTSFAEGYSDLANRALRYLSQVAGDKAVDSFAAARGRDLERRYAAVVESAGPRPRRRFDPRRVRRLGARRRGRLLRHPAVPGQLPRARRRRGVPRAVRRRDAGDLPSRGRPCPAPGHPGRRRARLHHPYSDRHTRAAQARGPGGG